MNKYQEAYNRLTSKEYKYASTESVYEDLEILKPLVDRSTPKKPRYEADGYADGELVYDTAYCPNCDKEFECDYGNWGDDYCQDCAQALDWSEEE